MKCNRKVLRIPPDLYVQWREDQLALPTLREADDPETPSEALLQQVWLHQRLRREALRTFDGHPVAILHPGFLNREAGPDFRQALLQIGDAPPVSGDIEIDLRCAGWRDHGHHGNPAYQGVRLHVVWEPSPPSPAQPPTIALRGALDAPLPDLRRWLGRQPNPLPPPAQRGLCATPLREQPPEIREALVTQAAKVRLETKAAWFGVRARDAGWEQALWEGLFAALGYKHNVWPMRRLAELLPLGR